jgi:hypothetical protein
MAYDSARAKVVLFVGGGVGGPFSETWEWDGLNGTWTNRTPPGSKPSPRSSPGLAYDSVRAKVVLCGGEYLGQKADTWEWDGDLGTWVERTTSGNPSCWSEEGNAMIFDNVRNRTVFFSNRGQVDKSVWEWDGNTWSNRVPTGMNPLQERGQFALVNDPTRGRVVMFGGYDSSYPQLDDTWEWDGQTGSWVARAVVIHPAARRSHAMAFDESRARTVLFGGYSGSNFGDTWEYVVTDIANADPCSATFPDRCVSGNCSGGFCCAPGSCP